MVRNVYFTCICNEDTLYAISTLSMATILKITIPKTCYSREIIFTYKALSTDLIESLKFYIQDLIGIPFEWISLSSYGQLLNDNLSLYDSGIAKSSVITASIIHP